jgi:hypothetical protein
MNPEFSKRIAKRAAVCLAQALCQPGFSVSKRFYKALPGSRVVRQASCTEFPTSVVSYFLCRRAVLIGA